MPIRHLPKRLLDRFVKSANRASELGLALLMTAGVVHCGGSTQPNTGEGTPDAAADHGLAVEAAQEGGTGIEEAGGDGSPNPMVEAAVFPDAGSDAHVSPMVEAPAPVVEAAVFPDAGSDAHVPPAESPPPPESPPPL
jgi:hypothetical protein